MSLFRIQGANCKNCYRCIRACPVNAIEFRGNQARVIEEECIYCCGCLRECPQNAKTVETDVAKVNRMLAEGKRIVVSLAPSFAGYTEDPKEYIARLYELGIAQVRETAEAAAWVSRAYAEQFHAKGKLVTTPCPVVVDYMEKYTPHLLGDMANTVSPMVAHAKWIKASSPGVKVVFVGPCYAKRKEMADHPGTVDAVLTFEEATQLRPGPQRAEQEQHRMEASADAPDFSAARAYPLEGGVIQTSFPSGIPTAGSSRYRTVSGIDNIKRLLSSMERLPEGYFLELNACDGGCMNGPASGGAPILYKQERVLSYMEAQNHHRYNGTEPPAEDTAWMSRRFQDRSRPSSVYSEAQIRSVLDKIGKWRKEDELNCGACGYSSCRDKAAAVLAGKAELYMCMPYVQAKAESFAHVLLEKTPNAVIAVTDQLLVKEVNGAAESFYQMDAKMLVGLPSDFLLDPAEVELSQTEPVRKKVYFHDLRKIAIVSASYVPEQQLYLVILHDLTEQEQEQEKLRSLKQETVEMAQRIIEKQMRVAQEIAGLLGETTAETKVTLTKMKRLLLEE